MLDFLEQLAPKQEYSEKDIDKATYIHIDPDDQLWELGYGNPIPVKASEDNPEYKNFPIFIY